MNYFWSAHLLSILPDASSHITVATDFDEFIFCCYRMNETLFFIHEKCIGHPNRFRKLMTESKSFHTRLIEWQPWIGPELTEVEIDCVVL